MLSQIRVLFALIFTIYILSGCAMGPEKPTADAAAVGRFLAVPPEEAIKIVEQQIEAAKQAELSFYAPNYFKLANNDFEEAKSLLAKKGDINIIANKLASAEASLQAGAKTKNVVTEKLAATFKLRDDLKGIQADVSFKSSYDDIIGDINSVIATFEVGNMAKAEKELATLNTNMKNFQVKVIKYNALHPAELVMDQAGSANAAKFAPDTYKIAQDTMRDSDAVIQQNALDSSIVAKAGESALFAANHALFMAQQVEKLPERVKTPEKYLLELEKQLRTIGQSIDAPDVRDRSIENQVATLAQTAKEKIDKAEQNSSGSKKAEELTEVMKKLEHSNKLLTSQLNDRDREIAELKSQVEHAQISNSNNVASKSNETMLTPSSR